MRRWLREPLIHFMLAGAALFGLYALLNPGGAGGDRVVSVTANEVAWLRETWTRQRQRPPDERELEGLVADYIREELLCREARELGLDENDTIVRRRLAQKMEFLIQDTVHAVEPSDEELARFYEANLERFQHGARVSFTHVFFNPDQGGDAAARAAAALEALSRPDGPADETELGDMSLVERELVGEDETSVAALFGPEFARDLFAVEPGAWQGPIRSGYGLHLVRVAERRATAARAFADARSQVLDEWRREQERAKTDAYFAALLRKYDVVADDVARPLLGALAPGAKGTR